MSTTASHINSLFTELFAMHTSTILWGKMQDWTADQWLIFSTDALSGRDYPNAKVALSIKSSDLYKALE